MTGTIVGSGQYTYEVNEDWAKLPEGWTMPAAAVTVDSQDRVYCFNRTPDHPVVVFDRDGNYLDSWGAVHVGMPLEMRVDPAESHQLVRREVAVLSQRGVLDRRRMTLREHEPVPLGP